MKKNTIEKTQKLESSDSNKSIAIVYFSGTGNTKALTKVLGKELSQNATVSIFKVEDILKQKKSFDVSEYEVLGLGYPIHGFEPAKNIYHFVKTLDKLYRLVYTNNVRISRKFTGNSLKNHKKILAKR